MKNLLTLLILIAVSVSCSKQDPQQQAVKTDSTFVPPDMGQDEIEVHEEHPRYLSRGQAEPDFWNPSYRSYKILPVYIEVDSALTASWGRDTLTNLTRLVQSSSAILERIAGPKIQLVNFKFWKKRDPYAAINSAGTVLYQWSAANQTKTGTFNFFLSRKNFGGIAFISRENVISTKYAVCGFGTASVGDAINYSYPVYCFTHELLHSLGISHTQNCCAWKDKSGNWLGRLDSCYSAEISCSPTPSVCSSTTKSMSSGLNSYCHLYNRIQYNLHWSVLPVLHRALFYSTLTDYTPSQQPPTTTNTFSIAGTPYTGYSRSDTAKAVDGNETTRFLTTGPTTLTWNFSQPTTRTQVYLSSGFNGGSPNQTLTLTVDGVDVPLFFDKKIKFTKAINATGRRFVLTTTGTGNISRIFEVSLK
jgi:hypothetical protein